MKHIIRALQLLFFAGSVTFAAETDLADRVSALEQQLADQSSRTLEGSWKNGYQFKDGDGSFTLQLGGRTQLDYAFFDADESLESETGAFTDGVQFRRIRLYLSGTIYEDVFFRTEYDFASDILAGTYIGLKNIPYVGTVRVGHQIEPTSLEENISNNYITFIERGTITAFNPVFNTGILAYNNTLDQRITWALGLFKDTDDKGRSVSNEAWAVSARITGLPFISDNGKKYVHLGVSGSHRTYDDGATYAISTRPQSRLAPTVVSTGKIPADTVDLLGVETIITLNQLSLQAEWMQSCVDREASADGMSPDSDVTFETYYVLASYLLTGEHRPYSKKSGVVTRIQPESYVTGGNLLAGAWELAARYDVIDLNDADIMGGEMESYTLGLNWYLNANTRIMWNYIQSDVQDVGSVDTFTMRFNIDF